MMQRFDLILAAANAGSIGRSTAKYAAAGVLPQAHVPRRLLALVARFHRWRRG